MGGDLRVPIILPMLDLPLTGVLSVEILDFTFPFPIVARGRLYCLIAFDGILYAFGILLIFNSCLFSNGFIFSSVSTRVGLCTSVPFFRIKIKPVM